MRADGVSQKKKREIRLVQNFSELPISPYTKERLSRARFSTPTPVQAAAIPQALEGKDVLGTAQTGTGKTLAFLVPIMEHLLKQRTPGIAALVLVPTRELAMQVADQYERLRGKDLPGSALVVGGLSEGQQLNAVRRGARLVVATPGRLEDLVDRKLINFRALRMLVLDEADRMLDLGFVKAIRRIAGALPKRRQNLFFSATMPDEIAALAGGLLADPIEVSVTPAAKTADRINHRVLLVETSRKRDLLVELFADAEMTRTIIFTRTKRGADKVAQHLDGNGIAACVIHGNKSQSQRERSLEAFRAGRARAMVATDIAARGIDIDGVTHVVNFELPEVAEAYVHRIGRTARAGAAGTAISLCDGAEQSLLRNIEKLTRLKLPAVDRRGGPPAATRLSAAPARPGTQNRRPDNNGHDLAREQRTGAKIESTPRAEPRSSASRSATPRFAPTIDGQGVPRFLSRQAQRGTAGKSNSPVRYGSAATKTGTRRPANNGAHSPQ